MIRQARLDYDLLHQFGKERVNGESRVQEETREQAADALREINRLRSELELSEVRNEGMRKHISGMTDLLHIEERRKYWNGVSER